MPSLSSQTLSPHFPSSLDKHYIYLSLSLTLSTLLYIVILFVSFCSQFLCNSLCAFLFVSSHVHFCFIPFFQFWKRPRGRLYFSSPSQQVMCVRVCVRACDTPVGNWQQLMRTVCRHCVFTHTYIHTNIHTYISTAAVYSHTHKYSHCISTHTHKYSRCISTHTHTQIQPLYIHTHTHTQIQPLYIHNCSLFQFSRILKKLFGLSFFLFSYDEIWNVHSGAWDTSSPNLIDKCRRLGEAFCLAFYQDIGHMSISERLQCSLVQLVCVHLRTNSHYFPIQH